MLVGLPTPEGGAAVELRVAMLKEVIRPKRGRKDTKYTKRTRNNQNNKWKKQEQKHIDETQAYVQNIIPRCDKLV